MSQEFPIKNLLGLNLRDSADKIDDKEFAGLQNVYQPTKGILAPRWGSALDSNTLPLASRIAGVWRHYAPNKERFTLYHCEPDATLIPDNTTDLTLSVLIDGLGNLGSGGGVVFRFCYSWIGRGIEQTYNTKNRAGFGALVFPLNAWSNTSHQSVTPTGGSRLDSGDDPGLSDWSNRREHLHVPWHVKPDDLRWYDHDERRLFDRQRVHRQPLGPA